MINNNLTANMEPDNAAAATVPGPVNTGVETPEPEVITVEASPEDSALTGTVGPALPERGGWLGFLEIILDFAKPIVTELVRKNTVQLSVTKTRDNISCNFSFQEDPISK